MRVPTEQTFKCILVKLSHKKTGNIHVIPLFSKPEQTQAKRVLISAQKDSKAPTVIHAGLVIHDEDGAYSPQANAILRLGETLEF